MTSQERKDEDKILVDLMNISTNKTEPFVCPECHRVSYHPRDKVHGYCGGCHAYTGTDLSRLDIFTRKFE